MGGAGYATGEVGQAFSLNGSSGYVNIPDAPSLDHFTTNITIDLWLKVNQLTVNADWRGIVTKGNSSWRLQGTSGANTIYFAGTGLSNALKGHRNVNDENWHHVAAVYNGTNIYLYVDGTLDVSTNATGSIAQNNVPLCLGKNAEASPGYYFNGLVDAVSIYNRALSASEIAAIYNAGSEGKCLPSPPVIFDQPTNQVSAVGGFASFGVTVTGSSPLSYAWRFNGTNISGATNSILTLTNLQLTEAGNYAVLVTNKYGSILSSNAELVVNPTYRFVWSQIPSPRFVGTPFAVVVEAQNGSNQIATNFTSSVSLKSTNGIPILPSVSGNFIQGVWTGSVSVAQAVTNLVLKATDGLGDVGVANPVNIVSLPALTTVFSDNSLLILWPVDPSGFVLETSPSLAPANWIPVSTPPFQVGDQYLFSGQTAGTNTFYRLIFPGP
jgi:hypothetical protein